VKSFCITTRTNSITDDNITDADEILAGIVALTIEETEADWRSLIVDSKPIYYYARSVGLY